MKGSPEPKEWAVVQLRLDTPNRLPAEWRKPLTYSVESEADLQDYTAPQGYIHRVHVVKRGFPTEQAANEWLKGLGIL